ncbi:flagellar biosynthesis protein FlhF [Heliorestis acidaminivorans]|uniref:Flagellar biosynthesis protein FlhF n=1 Tax=Heliorestis acidaminivorans TaxID=553427 RepID=A0A6I0F316_9FIRM|nr:flagellar biosynthesis protein FlhF [Heliorestis acidaminivorans]KAB2954381.1 flagellar biosynthesis protein FlhF [Heliorestis acidaminivorans]
MRVKRFVAKTMQEAMTKMKSEMGHDAVILHTRKVKEGGLLGFFTREMFEVTGAIENVAKGITKKTVPSTKNNIQTMEVLASLQEEETIKQSKEEPLIDPKTLFSTKTNDDGVKVEIKELKTMMGEILHTLNKEKKDLPVELQQIEEQLIKNDVEPTIAETLIAEIYNELGEKCKENPSVIREKLYDKVVELLGTPKPILSSDQRQQEVFILLGPTGVGKTTTVAKLAATFSIVDKRKVGLITVDTYRIAAVEQLKTFGEIIGVPVEVVFTPEALKTAIDRNRDKELILVDTAGRSHKNKEQIEELKAFVDACPGSKVMLALSLTTKYADLEQIIERFSSLNINRFLFTKLDETNHYGAILNILHKTHKPVSYITTGQNVPDDMEIADSRKIAKLICGEAKV